MAGGGKRPSKRRRTDKDKADADDKSKCVDDESGGGATAAAAATVTAEAAASAGASADPEVNGTCTICLDNDPLPIQSGCACRGDAGLAHVECRAEAAAHRMTHKG